MRFEIKIIFKVNEASCGHAALASDILGTAMILPWPLLSHRESWLRRENYTCISSYRWHASCFGFNCRSVEKRAKLLMPESYSLQPSLNSRLSSEALSFATIIKALKYHTLTCISIALMIILFWLHVSAYEIIDTFWYPQTKIIISAKCHLFPSRCYSQYEATAGYWRFYWRYEGRDASF